jgi:hypothetical protein
MSTESETTTTDPKLPREPKLPRRPDEDVAEPAPETPTEPEPETPAP